ncbi:flavin reductase family protein [Actinocrispum wychmicini]|uniref:flavin reductase family protein n=1 Tax=Actinocrispum wychmicini TaxID=1213861 RepID=UPI001A9F76DA|nr:flavin reductase family protein [Actinocrispum wychmicini]
MSTTPSTRALRDTLGRYATDVTVITTVHRRDPIAMTINSFTSVSLDPALILWCIHRSSRRGPAVTAARRVGRSWPV